MNELKYFFDEERDSFITKLKQEHSVRPFPIIVYIYLESFIHSSQLF